MLDSVPLCLTGWMVSMKPGTTAGDGQYIIRQAATPASRIGPGTYEEMILKLVKMCDALYNKRNAQRNDEMLFFTY